MMDSPWITCVIALYLFCVFLMVWGGYGYMNFSTPKHCETAQKIGMNAFIGASFGAWLLFGVTNSNAFHAIWITPATILYLVLVFVFLAVHSYENPWFFKESSSMGNWSLLDSIRIFPTILLIGVLGIFFLLPSLIVVPGLGIFLLYGRVRFSPNKSQNWATPDISSSKPVVQWMYGQMDVEQKAWLIDQKSTWTDLTPKQIQTKELLFILDYYRGVFMDWVRSTVSSSLPKIK